MKNRLVLVILLLTLSLPGVAGPQDGVYSDEAFVETILDAVAKPEAITRPARFFDTFKNHFSSEEAAADSAEQKLFFKIYDSPPASDEIDAVKGTISKLDSLTRKRVRRYAQVLSRFVDVSEPKFQMGPQLDAYIGISALYKEGKLPEGIVAASYKFEFEGKPMSLSWNILDFSVNYEPRDDLEVVRVDLKTLFPETARLENQTFISSLELPEFEFMPLGLHYVRLFDSKYPYKNLIDFKRDTLLFKVQFYLRKLERKNSNTNFTDYIQTSANSKTVDSQSEHSNRFQPIRILRQHWAPPEE